MDIAQAMAALQAARQGGGANPLAQLNPYGALQPGVATTTAAAAPGIEPGVPDYNSILQQAAVAQQVQQAQQGQLGMGGGVDPRAMMAEIQARRMQEFADRLGARTGGELTFDPTMGRHDMRQQFRDWRQAGGQPVHGGHPMGFGAGERMNNWGAAGMGGGMRPPGGMGGAPGVTPPANVATLPGAAAAAPQMGVQSGLGADYMKNHQRRSVNPDVAPY